jgi:GNAT superfamily N-acetyltransferase
MAELSLARIVTDVERGRFPSQECDLTVVPQPSARDVAVLAFTGHSVVAADVPADWVRAAVPDGDLSAPLCPPFLTALSERLGRRVNNVDSILLAPEPPDGGAVDGLGLRELTDHEHPRVRRALRYRDDVRVWVTLDGAGLVLLGRGLAGRLETAVEVAESHRGRGLGRTLALAARELARGVPLWAQIAPGNAASVRAFLGAGYRPVGAEALLVKD